MNSKPTFALIGAGAAGTALILALVQRGYSLLGIASRTLSSAKKSAELVNCDLYSTDPLAVCTSADIVVLATPDGEIRTTCDSISQSGGFSAGQIVLHLSGALGASALSSAKSSGAAILSFHPIQTLSNPEKGAQSLNGAYYCLEGDEQAIETMQTVVSSLEGKMLIVEERDKPLYHAALSVASNYLIVLEELAVQLLSKAGIEKREALPALLPLIQGAVNNLAQAGIPNALTGPISRGDSSTIESHLEALSQMPEEVQALYRLLGKSTVKVAKEKGTIPEEAEKAITKLLSS